MSTFNSQTTSGTSRTTSSSFSARRFDLKEDDKHDILVYKMYSGKGYEFSSQERLCKELDAAPPKHHWRCARVPIPAGASRVEIKTRDLFSGPEQQLYKDLPNQSNALASCPIPRRVFWRRLFLGDFKDMYVLSPDSSRETSKANSSDGSAAHSPIERVETPEQL
jgi:hypothetical protein